MKLLTLPHTYCECTCMVNGLEDLYHWKTGVALPDYVFYFIGGIVGFTYLKHKNAPIPRTVYWGTGLSKMMYAFLADIVGYSWSLKEGASFSYALDAVKHQIDEGNPVVMGKVDIYHLPYYEKYYHKVHIPAHTLMCVGYDDEHAHLLVHDCGRSNVQILPYADLEQAWNVTLTGVCRKNRFFTFQFDRKIASIETIVYKGLKKKAASILRPPVKFMGIPGMQKLAKEFPAWEGDLDPATFRACLLHLVTFAGSFVPILPARLSPIPIEERMNNHQASRDKFAVFLRQLAERYQEPSWAESAEHFQRSGELARAIVECITDTLSGQRKRLSEVPEMLENMASLETQGFTLIDHSIPAE